MVVGFADFFFFLAMFEKGCNVSMEYKMTYAKWPGLTKLGTLYCMCISFTVTFLCQNV